MKGPRKIVQILIALLAITPLAESQDQARLTPITIESTPMSPGGLVVLTATGIPLTRPPNPEPFDSPGPWRTEFGEVTVNLRSDPPDGGPLEQRLPIAMVSPNGWSCGIDDAGKAQALTPECVSTKIIVQLPFTARPNADVLGGAARHLLWLSGPGWRSPRTSRTVVPSAVKILSACQGLYDALTDGCVPNPRFEKEGGTGDGVVRPGDRISLYATGLGPPQHGHQATIGEAVVEEVPTLINYRLAFEYRAAAPLRPNSHSMFRNVASLPGWIVVEPTYVGLHPGAIGIYRMDFRIPEPPPGALNCPFGGVGGNGELRNLSLTVFGNNVTGASLTDSTAFCVQTDP